MVFKVLTAVVLVVAATSASAAPRLHPIWDTQIVPPTTQVEPSVGTVPEPATWAMMIVGFGLVGVMRRRNRSVVA